MPRLFRSWIVPAVVSWGLACLGVGLALHYLPEWAAEDLEDPAYFTGRLEDIARELDIALLGDRPEVQLVIPSGPGNRILHKRVRAAQRSVWLHTEGRLQASFAPHGELSDLTWMPLSFQDFFELAIGRQDEVRRPEDLAPLLLWPGERLGAPLVTTVAGVDHQLIPLLGSAEPTYLEIAVSSSHVFEVSRRVGEARQELGRVSQRLVGRLGIRLALRTSLFVLVVGVFLFLLAKRRVDFRDGLYLMIVALVVPLPSLALQARGGLSWWQVTPGIVFAALFLMLLWSVSESWARTTEHGFTTSLDFLRAGHLGRRGGRALLAGWMMGAGLAGWNLLAHVVALWLPNVYAEEASVPLPVFGLTGHPFYQGPMVAGCILLAIPVAHRLLPARWRLLGASCVGALLLVPSSAFASIPFAFAAAWGVSLWLIFTYRRFGLAALLVASTSSLLMAGVAMLWPVAAVWAPMSFAVSLLCVLGIPLLGWVGARRPPELYDKALVPGFMQRVEEERRVKYEMALLARMQRGMLPGEPPALPGYEIDARSELASEAGGDLYDFVTDDEGCLWLAAGDVAGHGYSCTIELAMIKAAIHSLVDSGSTPAEVLSKIDQVLRSSRNVRSFSSLTLLRLQPASGHLVLANAGHPFPWVWTPHGVRELELPGLPLGQGPPRVYQDMQLRLEPGQALMMASDGLFETVGRRGETYGFDRPRRLFEAHGGQPVSQILQAIVDDWKLFLGRQAIADDTSLVALRRLPSATEET